ncbi:MAG: PKD domain-containing protein [Saprospiraceae bacterium]|nr:PKD domain-containing protein [Saprospiraceae bacterium]
MFCEGSLITLANTSSIPDWQIFFVDWGDGQIDTITNYNDITHTYDYSGIDRCAEGPEFIQTICWIGRKTCPAGESCNTGTTFISVLLRPVARFSAPSEVCINTPVNFSENSCNVPPSPDGSYLWNFGDGNTSTLPNPSHTYATPGNYTVSLTVTNTCGSDTQTRPVRVVAPPEAAFSYTPANGCGPTTISFTDQANQWSNTVWSITPADTTRWRFADTTMTLNTDDIVVNFLQPGAYTVRQRAFNACGEDFETVTINIYQPPNISLTAPPPSCDQVMLSSAGLNFSHSGEITNFQWTFTNGTPASATGPTFSGVTFMQSGSITLTITSPCGDQTQTVPVTVANTDPIAFAPGNPATLCVNAMPAMLQATPANGQWSGTGIDAAGVLNPAGLNPGIYTYTYSTGAVQCPNSSTTNVEILPAVTAAIAPVNPACESLNYSPQVSYTGAVNTYNWSFPGGNPSTSMQANPTGIQYNMPGTFLATVEATGACGTALDTVEIVVQANVQLNITPPQGPLCSGSSPIALEVNQQGGVWSGNGITDADTGIFDPGIVTPGQANNIQYTLDNGPCSASANISITVVASANISFPADTFCIDSDPRALSIMPLGGSFSGNGVDTMTGVFDPAAAGINTHDIGYAFTDANGCMVNAVAQILVEDTPLLGLPDTTLLCLSAISINLPVTVGFAPNPPGGTAIWSGPGIQNPQGDFNAGTLSEGVYAIVVEYRRNDCVVRDTILAELTQPQPLAISPDTTVCISDQFLQLQTNLSGGQWFGPGVDNNGRIDLQAAGGNTTHTYRYEFAIGTNCEQTASLEVEIIDLGALVNAGPDIAICAGAADFTLGGASPADGYWLGTGIVNAQTGSVDLGLLELDSTYTYQYCIESQAVAGCMACDSRTFVVYSNPVAEFSLDGTACIGETFGVQNTGTGADQFRWNFGDGSPVVTLPNPEHQYASSGNYTIELIAINSATTCRDTATFSVFVTTPPIAAFTLEEDEGCAPFPLVIQDGSSGFEIQRTWFVAGDTTMGAPPIGVLLDSITQDSIFIIRLEARNLCGVRTAEAEVLVRPYPIVRFGVFPDEGCSPLEIELSNATVGNPQTYFWDLGNGTTSTDSLPSFPVYTTPDTTVSIYTITLISTNACGADTLSKEVVVYPPDVQAFIEVDTLSGCAPLVIQAESFSTPGAIISWLVLDPAGNQEGSVLNAPQFTLQLPGTHTIILYASRCGMDADTVSIEVLPAPQVFFSHRPFICVGQPIVFANTSVNISGSEWTFGDGNGSADFSPTHIFEEPGEYTVTLTAYSLSNNCPATFSSTVTVIGNPVAAFTPSATNGCGPLTIQFTSNSTPGVNHVWDFGDGGAGAFGPNPEHTFQSPGNYEVRLTVYDADSCFTDVAISNIFVFPDPIADFNLPNQLYCLGYDSLQPVNLSQGAAAYRWRWQNDTFNLNEPVIIPQTAGTFPLELIAINTFECRDTFVRLANILPSPVAVALPDAGAGCQPLFNGFGNQSQHAATYLWDFGDGNTSTATTPSHTYEQAGTFTGTLTAGSANGCPADTAQFVIEVWPKPMAAFQLDRPELCGAPAEVRFENLSALAQSADWDFGDGNASTAIHPIHIYQTPGVYPVRLMVTNIYQCRDTAIGSVDVYGRPLAAFALDNPSGCEDFEVVFQNNSTEALRYEWRVQSFPDVFSDTNPRVLFTEPGTYDVQLIAIYNDLCRDTLLRQNYVRVYSSPTAAFRYEADNSVNVLGDVSFINESHNAQRFFWDLGDGTTTTLSDPEHEYSINRSIEVLLIAYHDNGGAFTCADSIRQPVDPEWITTFFAPNALSPGYGPEGVQVFKPVGIGLLSYRIAVYSPWGEQVWYSEALDDSSPTESWNGAKQNRGDTLPQGAYTWRADVVFVNGVSRIFTGSVTLLR